MATQQELIEARAKFETALQEYIRLTRPDVGNVFVQDYVITTASESMDPGHENITYLNHVNRVGMPTYACVGLLDTGLAYYREAGRTE